MRRPAYELILALLTIVGITVWYGYEAQRGVPRPGGLLGHGLGIIGFLMMLSTETLYTLRKRARRFHFGRTSTWLNVHIFTGIVGPYLVVLHSGGKFNGLAGVLTALTVVMVVSGFVGRYIYTAVPRSLDGAEIAVQELEGRIAQADQQLQALGVDPQRAAASDEPHEGWKLVLGRGAIRRRQERQAHRAVQELGQVGHAQAAQLEALLGERYRLQTQIRSVAVTRRLLAVWHVLHIPLGGVLFTLAFIHIGAALYYATLMK